MVNGLLTIAIKVNVPFICRINFVTGTENEKGSKRSRFLELARRIGLGISWRQRLNALKIQMFRKRSPFGGRFCFGLLECALLPR
jgi:hypothetical protein